MRYDENWHKVGTTEWAVKILAQEYIQDYPEVYETIGVYSTLEQAQKAAAKILPSTETEHNKDCDVYAEIDRVVSGGLIRAALKALACDCTKCAGATSGGDGLGTVSFKSAKTAEQVTLVVYAEIDRVVWTGEIVDTDEFGIVGLSFAEYDVVSEGWIKDGKTVWNDLA